MSTPNPTTPAADDDGLLAKLAREARDNAHAAASTASGHALPGLTGPMGPVGRKRSDLHNPAGDQLVHVFAHWRAWMRELSQSAWRALSDGIPVDPNHESTWTDRYAHTTSVLRRHGISRLDAGKLTPAARAALISGQAAADEAAGLDWTVVYEPAVLQDKLRVAHATLPIDLDTPDIWTYVGDQRTAAARRLNVPDDQADDLSRHVLRHPQDFTATDLRSWRVGSPTWMGLAADQLGDVHQVDRPVGCFLAPATDGRGWVLIPALSLDMIRLVGQLGGTVDRRLTECAIPTSRLHDLLSSMNTQVLHSGPKELVDSVTQLSQAVSSALGHTVRISALHDKVDRWGRLKVLLTDSAGTWSSTSPYPGMTINAPTTKDSYQWLRLTVTTTPVKGFQQRRLGSAAGWDGHTSARMDLGEAVETAVERGVPLLLSSEAAGLLADRVRVGRMKGKPGMVTVTQSDGLSATTRKLVAEQAVNHLRELRAQDINVMVDPGAHQMIRMAVAKPLDDDPILLPPQRHVASLMVVGSGVNASMTGTGKTVVTARSLYHRAASTRRFRGMVVATGRLIDQWRTELTEGAPGRGLPPLAPNIDVLVIDEHSSIAGQLRRMDRLAGETAALALVPNSILDRYTSDLQALRWHVLIADEALRYVNPATEAHRALRQVRFGSVADCWLLTATPKGKDAEHLDVLVGLSVGDEGMITDRLNTREAGNLMDEVNAHRLRVNYGPHLVRVTRKQMQEYMPKVLPAKALAIEPDGALQELLDEIRAGGRDAYQRLLQVLRQLKTLEKGTDLYKQALVEMSRAQASVLGNVGVFVDASIDPETLKHSDAALAQALTRNGLVDAAIRGGGDGLPLLRSIVAQTIQAACADDQVLVFADRTRCLHQLAGTLRDRYGVDARVGDGKVCEAEFDELKRQFNAGEFPVFLLSPVGEEGHNLQVAGTLVHLDMPWVDTKLEQRVGRSARPGSRKDYVQTYIPYIKGGGIEHVVSLLARRGAESHMVLDSFEGVQASESTIAAQLGEITSQVADSKDDAGYKGTAARLRVAASVFGT